MTGIVWFDAASWAGISSLGLLVGAVLGLYGPLGHRGIARTMAVGAGILLAVASVDLLTESIELAGRWQTSVGVLLGAVTFSAVNAWLATRGAKHRKRCGVCAQQADEAAFPGSGLAIAVGTLLDVIPEGVILGVETVRAGAPGPVLLLAFFLGNLPEAISGSAGMVVAGRSRRYIFAVWVGAALAGVFAAGAGALLLTGIPPHMEGWISAFAAGALLAMVVETMIPEAVHGTPVFVGLIAAAGFSAMLLLLGAT